MFGGFPFGAAPFAGEVNEGTSASLSIEDGAHTHTADSSNVTETVNSFYKVTINGSYVIGSHSNFVHVLEDFPATFIDGGADSADNGGGNIRVYSDADFQSRLSLKVVSFNTSTGTGQLKVLVPNVGGNTDYYVVRQGGSQPAADEPYGSDEVDYFDTTPPAGSDLEQTYFNMNNVDAFESISTLYAGDVIWINGAISSHGGDSLSLVQNHVAATADGAHVLVTDNLVIGASGSLSIAEATHSQGSDNLAITTETALVIQNALSGHVADNLSFAQSYVLNIGYSLHIVTGDVIALDTGLRLNTRRAEHFIATDGVTLTQNHNIILENDEIDILTDSVPLKFTPGIWREQTPANNNWTIQ